MLASNEAPCALTSGEPADAREKKSGSGFRRYDICPLNSLPWACGLFMSETSTGQIRCDCPVFVPHLTGTGVHARIDE